MALQCPLVTQSGPNGAGLTPHSIPICSQPRVLMGGAPTRRFFAFGLVAGALPLAFRLSFSSASAVEAAVRAVLGLFGI